DYTEAIRLDPKYPGAYANRAQAYEAKGDTKAARADYAAAAALPLKYNSGKWAHDTARARLAVLKAAPAKPPAVTTAPVQPAPTAKEIPSPPRVAPLPSSDRVALVIGNSSYKVTPLRNPSNDARAMAATLGQIGFKVTAGYDLDYSGMRRVIAEFLISVSSARLAVVYYAGHGVQLDGRNYLVPTDAKLANKRTAGLELFDLDQILVPLDDPTRSNVVFLDACRNNPFASQTATTRAVDTPAGLSGYTIVSSGM